MKRLITGLLALILWVPLYAEEPLTDRETDGSAPAEQVLPEEEQASPAEAAPEDEPAADEDLSDTDPAEEPLPDEVERTPLDTLRLFAEAYNRIKLNYVEQVDDSELVEAAIRGMLESLDPHSAFLVKEDYDELQESTQGEFGGLGIEISLENGLVKVIAPMDDTPAMKAGVQAGDLIIKLDDKPIKGMPLNKAVDLMRGKPGTDITLTILREGEKKPLEITVTRDIIQIASVKSRVLDEQFGYIRISNFQNATARDMVSKLQELHKEIDGPIRGLVLDLRNNPGGVLNAAVSVSDAFLEGGLIVYTEGRTEDSRIKYAAKSGDILSGAPIIVLVNEGSASASEIVAGALQDHKRAVIMGTQTFGKGSVQTVVPLRGDGAMRLTTARYYTPSGRSIQALGISPDIIVEQPRPRPAGAEEDETPAPRQRSEAELRGALDNDSLTEDEIRQIEEDRARAEAAAQLREDDYQLAYAIDILKGLTALQPSKE